VTHVRWTIVASALGAIVTCQLFGQSAAALKFEVASFKPSAPNSGGLMLLPMPLGSGELRVSNITVRDLVMSAYDVRAFQISGGPSWISSERYDVFAKPEGGASSQSLPTNVANMTDDQRKVLLEQLRQRTQALLADRFNLAIHKESREEQVYALVAGKDGPKLVETKEGTPEAGQMMMGRGLLNGRGVGLQTIAGVLSAQLDRPVRDQTELHGRYDIKLEWTPDPGLGGPFGALSPGGGGPPPSAPDKPSLFTALQEQLGLRLESRRGPVEIIVIDRVERPSEN
jgi:bla regulator protein blaR1